MKHLFTTLFLATALAAQAAIPADVLENLASSDLTKRFAAETKLRQLAYAAGKPGVDPATAAALEKDLMALASDTAAPEPSRLGALEQLPFLATASSVPSLGALLSDPTPPIREAARCALRDNPDPTASAQFLQALEKADQPAWTLGLMDTLATRADASAIPAFAARLTSPNPAISSLAAQSLGSLGGAESLKALNSFLPNCPPAILPAAQGALVRCATKQADGDKAISALWPKAVNASIRCEIFNALTSLGDGAQAAPLVAEVIAKQETPATTEILHLAVLSGNAKLKDPVLAALPTLKEDARLAVHAALAQKLDTSREDDLLSLAAALDGKKKNIAIELLGFCGTEKSVDFLVAEAMKKSPQTLPSASFAINHLKVPGLDQRLMEQAVAPPGPVAAQAMMLLSFRNPEGTENVLLKLVAPDAPTDSKASALSALENVGGFESGTRLIQWIAMTPSGKDPKPYVALFRRIAPRIKAASALWKSAFLPAFESAPVENRSALLLTIPGLRCPESGATLVEWIRTNKAAMRTNAIEQLLSWSSFDAGDSILAAATLPELDAADREKLFQGASKLFLPTVHAEPHLKKDYAKKVLAAAPEGPMRDSIQEAMKGAGLSN
jgi:HEAT repeat protein